MGQPITWRTIMGPSPAEATRGLELAQRSINAGFGNFTNAFNQAEDRNTTILNTEKAANLLGLKNALKEKYTTPEAYQQAVASGEIGRMVGQYGNQINGEAAAQFTDGRLKELRTGVLDNINYTDKTTEAAQRPVVESLYARLYAGDKTAIADAQKLGIRNLSKLAETNYNIGNNAFDQSIKGANLGINAAELGMKQQTLPHQINQMKASAAAANAGVKLSRDIFNMNKADKEADNIRQVAEFLSGDSSSGSSGSAGKSGASKGKLSDNNMFNSGTLDTEEGRRNLIKGIEARKLPPNVAQDILDQDWTELTGPDGKKSKQPIPVSLILSKLDNTSELGSGSFWSTRGDSARSLVKNMFKGDTQVNRIERDQLMADYTEYLKATSGKNGTGVSETRNLDALRAAMGYSISGKNTKDVTPEDMMLLKFLDKLKESKTPLPAGIPPNIPEYQQ